LAEWMGAQVAAKQLLSLQNKAKDEVRQCRTGGRQYWGGGMFVTVDTCKAERHSPH